MTISSVYTVESREKRKFILVLLSFLSSIIVDNVIIE